MLRTGSPSWPKCMQMPLAISMLKNIFLLHTKMKHMTLAICVLKNIFPLHAKPQDYHPNVLLQMS